MEGGRKRRSEMSAPIPIGKESLRADPERQSNMVTLRKGGGKLSSSTALKSSGSGVVTSSADDKTKAATSKAESGEAVSGDDHYLPVDDT